MEWYRLAFPAHRSVGEQIVPARTCSCLVMIMMMNVRALPMSGAFASRRVSRQWDEIFDVWSRPAVPGESLVPLPVIEREMTAEQQSLARQSLKSKGQALGEGEGEGEGWAKVSGQIASRLQRILLCD